MMETRKLLAVLAAALLVGAAGSAIALTDRNAQADRPDAAAPVASGANATDAPSAAAASPDVDPKAAQVLSAAAASASRLDYVHGKATTTVTRGGQSSTTEAEFYADRSGAEAGVRVLAPDRSAGDTLIVDGSSATAYDASNGAAYVADGDSAKAAERGAKSAMTGATAPSSARAAAMRAAMMQAGAGQSAAPDSANATEARADAVDRAAAAANAATIGYEGTATVDGEETVVLRIATADGATVTLYHDAETYLPERIVVEAGGTTAVTTFCYYAVEFCPTDAAAPFGVPDDATVVPVERAVGGATGAAA